MDFFSDPLAYVPPQPAQVSDKPGVSPVVVRRPRRPEAVSRRERFYGFQIPQGKEAAALEKMRLIKEKVVLPATTGQGLAYTRALLAEILRGAPGTVNGHKGGKWAEVIRVFYWIRGRIRYVLDPANGKELFQALPVTIQQAMGDCDDFTGALASLLKALGFRVAARCIAIKPGGPYVHIYPLVEVGGRWHALDATENHPPGWEARHTRVLDLEL